MSKPPNVLILMSDEHRFDVAGYAGDPVVRTPTLDALAASGVVFDNAYTPSPICVPARQCLAAGQFPRTCGVEWYGQDLPPNAMTFARRFSQYGYQTVAAGKLHHLGTDQMQGWRRRIGNEMETASWYVEDREQDFADRFTEPMTHKWDMVEEIRRAGLGPNPLGLDDDYTVWGARQFLHRHFLDTHYDRATPDTPLLLMVSLNEPHYPFATRDEDLFAYYLNRVTVHGDEVFDHPFLGERFVARPGIEVTERQARRAVAAYYAMVETADRHFAEILETLHNVGQDLDDWVVVYTSDHGEMLGAHGVWEKQKFFEHSVRVPLIVRHPKRFAPARVDSNVNLCDLFATLCELASVSVPEGLDSRSLVPLLEGYAGGWDDESVSQFGASNLMIKRGTLKYQYYGPDMPEVLFDLDADRKESANLIDAPRYADAVRAFRRRAAELGFPTDKPADTARGR